MYKGNRSVLWVFWCYLYIVAKKIKKRQNRVKQTKENTTSKVLIPKVRVIAAIAAAKATPSSLTKVPINVAAKPTSREAAAPLFATYW